MRNYSENIRPHVESELKQAAQYLRRGEPMTAFTYLESAHVLGQESTYLHVLAHVHMARWALGQKDTKEFLGQVLRIVGAATKTAMGLVPTGNTGGANISPFKPLPLSSEHKKLILRAKSKV